MKQRLSGEDLSSRKREKKLNFSNQNLSFNKICDRVSQCRDVLRKLNLSNCGLTELPKALASCFKLEEIDLSHNNLDNFTRRHLGIQSLHKLKKLDLSDCGLYELPCGMPSNVQELNLSCNFLDHEDDLLKYLNGEKISKWLSFSLLGNESEPHFPRVLELSKLKKIVFMDSVYTKSWFGRG